MILIIGGQGAGKRSYARERGFGEDEASALFDLHLFLKERGDVTDELLESLCAKKVITCNEIGCGIVPMDAADRAWRDRVGRTCALLAARAEQVVRLCCGIPVVIKDSAGGGRA